MALIWIYQRKVGAVWRGAFKYKTTLEMRMSLGRGFSTREHHHDADPNTTPGVVLHGRPAPNSPVTSNHFAAVPVPVDHGSCQNDGNHILAETLYLSVDPFLRCRFNENTGVDYTAPFKDGQPLSSAGIGFVIESTVPGFVPGDLVLDSFDGWPWQRVVRLGASEASKLQRLPHTLALLVPITYTLGCVGQTGVTAYFGMLHECPPKAGDCVIISAAAGAVGSVAGQLAKQHGCRVVGIVGSDEKCRLLTNTLGFDAAVNRHTPDFEHSLEAAVGPQGAHIYFDNVGGEVTDAVVPCLQSNAHIVLCGQIAMYDSDVPYPPPLSAKAQAIVDQRNITRKRFLVFNYRSQFSTAIRELLALAASGHLVGLEQFYRGVRQAPNAFLDLMIGRTVGKTLIQVATPPLGAVTVYNRLRPLVPPVLRAWAARRLAPLIT